MMGLVYGKPLYAAEVLNQETVEETVQEITTNVNRYQQYIKDHIPDIAGFGIKVVLAIAAFYVGGKLIKWLLKVVRNSMERAGVDKGVIQFVGSLAKFMLYMILIFSIAIQFGVEESSVAALLGTAGVTIGLALQGGLSNLAGGVMLLLFKPFQVGDYIVQDQAKGCEGTVDKIEICYTTLLSVDNKHIVIPNGTLSNSTIINVTARDMRKLEIKVGISYDSDVRLAKATLEELLKEDPDTKDDKDMVVCVDELGESAVVMALRVWVPTDRYWPAKWRLNERIKEEFDNRGIVIPYNQLEVHVHQKEEN